VYRAPELIRPRYDKMGYEMPGEFSRKTDMWAVGCILHHIATTGKSLPFRSDWEVMAFSMSESTQIPEVSKTANPTLERETFCAYEKKAMPVLKQINSMIGLCLCLQPEHRATAMQLKVRFERMKENL
jgi:serine/threonine protein kinase